MLSLIVGQQINAASSASGGEALWQEGEVLAIARATRADAATWRCSGQDTAGKTISGKPTYLLIYGESEECHACRFSRLIAGPNSNRIQIYQLRSFVSTVITRF